ncbi:MAG: ribose 5-phosphate isomerase A, partial [Candidatus Thermoplasmatota archaeon]|nr:ribose 5-phosphate isomerase A [Candidatus Thermoplasmatota archaeon]
MRAFSSEEAKEVAALAAVEMVREGEVLAIGSGSTVDKAIRALGHRFSDSVRKPAVVAASRQSESLVREVGLPLLSLS